MFRSPFTASQWQELEHQALILKYLLAGVPVPPDLVFSIRRSFGSMPACFDAIPTLGYCTYFGKKLDPEPGRCRRTDGKKWRCSKDAYPDSKYCERHVHRKKNRSRKPVESQSLSQLQPSSSSTATSLTPALSISGSVHNSPLQYSVSSGGSAQCLNLSSYGMCNKDYRYLNEAEPDVDMHSFISEACGSSSKGLGVDPSLASSAVSYPQLQSMHDFGQQPVKQESNPLSHLFDEWQRTGDLWSELAGERSNQLSLSNTQLSISIPMASSDFTMGSRSSNNDGTRDLIG